MKQIKLSNIILTNFKGIKHFELNVSGNNVRIFGDNATGKTTLFDAFVWLLFDKDSQNKKDFQIKTLLNGKPISKLDHEVEATLLIDGEQLTLKKLYKEKWTKKRGSSTADFTGHTTDYYVNGVPSKKKEYEEKVASIVDEGIFKLLTNPAYFNEQLKKDEKRNLLLEIAGNVTEEEVINNNPELEKLKNILNGNSIEDHKKIIAAKRKDINKELDRIPIRIDEIHRGLPDTNGLNKEQLTQRLQDISEQSDEKYALINDIRGGSEVNAKRQKLSEIDLQISNVKNDHTQQGQEEVYKLKSRLQEEQSNVSILKSKVSTLDQRKRMNESSIKELEERMTMLREEWTQKNSEEFDHESSCECPTCGQGLPEEQLEEVKSNFNRNKSKLLETIQGKGMEAKQKADALKQENESIAIEISKIDDQISAKETEVSKLQNKLTAAESEVKPITENASYNQLMQDRQAVEQQIDELQSSVEQEVQKVQQEIQELKEKQNSLSTDLNALKESERAHSRIAELEQKENELGEEYERLEHELYLTEEFVKTKVNLLEEKINNKFEYARFNLFRTNINGGLEEICETTFKGVPYSSGLNNAARINVGLDIINTLSKHYGVQAPIFVDNAESVTKLIDIDAQVISLVVSEGDKELRIDPVKEMELV
ncbi:AAA family ATPase [Virgibacillus halodenitrificans]|uniref:Nuclease SbcCD subunit C n=1 Tax=Virgibacillus halodenitrificans TaxID=1482 RepID=A0ABR7VMX2_VIRHA|nr:AAA family ATPase [Virgibacillus halodenitrificans]MBD1223259.1 AAA family ATPase [Virgibacillus halodenitrificans]